jgi:hypothetical protein
VQTTLVKAIGISSVYFIERHVTYSNRVKAKAASVLKRNADFIEPMECAPVTKLIDGPGWVSTRAPARVRHAALMFLRSVR